MQCPVCKGTGVMELPHVPGNRGGWLDTTYTFSGMECGACNGTGVRPDRDEVGKPTRAGAMMWPTAGDARSEPAPPEPPSAEEQLGAARAALISALRHADHIPPDVSAGWIGDLPLLDVYRPETGQAVLADIRQEFTWAKERFRPARDIFSMSVTAEMGFDGEMREIERHLGFLEALMEHAASWLSEHPEERRNR